MKRYLIWVYCAVLAFSLTACFRPEDTVAGEESSSPVQQQESSAGAEDAPAGLPENGADISEAETQPNDSASVDSPTAAPENGQPWGDGSSADKPAEAPSAGTTAKPTTKPTTQPTTKPTAEATTKPSDAPAAGTMTGQVAALVNAERAKAGLSPLTLDTELSANAAVRAQEIVEKFDHTRPDGSKFSTAVTIEWRTVGENIAYGQSSPEAVMNAWMNSSGHRANILNADFDKIGVGVVRSGGRLYWVQLFAG